MMMAPDAVFLIGLFGGASSEILHWWGLREQSSFPDYARSIFYWVITLLMIGVGGGVAYLQLGPGGESLPAFEIGLLTPMLLKKLASQAPQAEGAQAAAQGATLRGFLKG